MGLDQPRQSSGLEVSDGHQKGSVGSEETVVVGDHMVAIQQPDFAQAAPWVSTQRVRP